MIDTAQRTDKGTFQEKECGVQHQGCSEIMLEILNYVIKVFWDGSRFKRAVEVEGNFGMVKG